MSGQKASVKMRDFDLLRGVCGWSEVNEQRPTSTIYGGAKLMKKDVSYFVKDL